MRTFTKFLCFILVAFSFVARSQGFILDEDYSRIPVFKSTYSGEKMGNALSPTEDLSKKVSIQVVNQGDFLNCLTISVYNYAYTIQRALIDAETDPVLIREKTLSAMYPYISITRAKCDSGIKVQSLIAFNSEKGNIKYLEFPDRDCKTPITDDIVKKAMDTKAIKNFEVIFDKAHPEISTDMIKSVKEQLNKNERPVVFGMMVSERFKRINRYDNFYVPSKHGLVLGKGYGHAMTVVGYDDNTEAFKVLNSWGEGFGNGGYFWIKYEDFKREAIMGLVLILYDHEPGDSSNEKGVLKGRSYFLHEDRSQRRLKLIEGLAHKGDGLYELEKKDWKKGDLFQLQIGNGQSGQSIFVFSIDNSQTLNLHWPFQSIKELNDQKFGMVVNDQVGTRKQTIYIPAENERMDIQKPGDDYLCVLYSNKPLIPEMQDIISKINQSTEKDVVKKIQNALGTKLIKDVNYQSDDLRFTTDSEEGDTVLLVLKVHSVR